MYFGSKYKCNKNIFFFTWKSTPIKPFKSWVLIFYKWTTWFDKTVVKNRPWGPQQFGLQPTLPEIWPFETCFERVVAKWLRRQTLDSRQRYQLFETSGNSQNTIFTLNHFIIRTSAPTRQVRRPLGAVNFRSGKKRKLIKQWKIIFYITKTLTDI